MCSLFFLVFRNFFLYPILLITLYIPYLNLFHSLWSILDSLNTIPTLSIPQNPLSPYPIIFHINNLDRKNKGRLYAYLVFHFELTALFTILVVCFLFSLSNLFSLIYSFIHSSSLAIVSGNFSNGLFSSALSNISGSLISA